jgi:hypothetical protein
VQNDQEKRGIYPLKRNRINLLRGLSLVILSGVLFFGLRPKGFHSLHGVNWKIDKPGIRFGSYGIAYTDLSSNMIKDIYKSDSFSLELAIKADNLDHKGFNFILLLHDGRDSDQLVIGQYRSSLIIMNGDDYSNRRKTKRLVVSQVLKPPREIFLAITTGPEGTKAYIDGLLVKEKKDLRLNMPQGGGRVSLVLGNSVYGNNFWKGDICGLAFYGFELTSKQIELHAHVWSKDQGFSYARQHKPLLLYLFDEKKGQAAIDHGNGNSHLHIPQRMHILKRRILSLPRFDLMLKKSGMQDLVINLLGFIPLGFILSATFIHLGGTLKKRALFITVALCFVISLVIEVSQGWIPSRSSQILDLILNTGGALIGVIMYKARNIVT